MNKNENYIMLNGKKIPLTSEQVKLIQADEVKKSPFDRAELHDEYYFVDGSFLCICTHEFGIAYDDERFECSNYCTDENIMRQHALHMQLNNLLWRYSMTHGGNKIDWNNQDVSKSFIYFNNFKYIWSVAQYTSFKEIGVVCFVDEDIAEAAIVEIVKPFIAAHPDFDVTKM